ncbi:MAG: hypothetical protein V4751_13835 [Pseudomonadota bacterium]
MEWDETLNLALAILSTSIAIYQWAVINERKDRDRKMQFLLASVSHTALSKAQEWINQISLFPPPQNDTDLQILRLHARARDEIVGISNLVSALEGAIDPKSSAITAILEKTLKQGELNNQIQQVGLLNPTRGRNQVQEAQNNDGH